MTGVAFSPDGTLLAAAYSDGYVRLWDLAARRPAGASLPAGGGPGGSVSGVAFSPDGKLLASADTDGTVRTWQIPLFADPYAALCADVWPPTKADWRNTPRVNHSQTSADDTSRFRPAVALRPGTPGSPHCLVRHHSAYAATANSPGARRRAVALRCTRRGRRLSQ